MSSLFDRLHTEALFSLLWFLTMYLLRSDMADRIGMRDVVQASLGWCPPPDDPPDWRIWRDRISRQPENIRYSSVSSSSTRFDICRCVRGFVAWKRTTDEAPPVPDKSEYVSNRP